MKIKIADDEYTLHALRPTIETRDVYMAEIEPHLKREYTGREAGVRIEVDYDTHVQFFDGAAWRDRDFDGHHSQHPERQRIRLHVLKNLSEYVT